MVAPPSGRSLHRRPHSSAVHTERPVSWAIMHPARGDKRESFGLWGAGQRTLKERIWLAGEDERRGVGRCAVAALDADEILVAEVVLDKHVASASLAGLEVCYLATSLLFPSMPYSATDAPEIITKSL